MEGGGSKKHAFRRGGGGGVDFVWNNPISKHVDAFALKAITSVDKNEIIKEWHEKLIFFHPKKINK